LHIFLKNLQPLPPPEADHQLSWTDVFNHGWAQINTDQKLTEANKEGDKLQAPTSKHQRTSNNQTSNNRLSRQLNWTAT